MKYTDLSLHDRQDIIRRVQAENDLNRQIIEKDWWVTAVLRALFSLPYAEHMSFKGGTNLSKCWNLINRMSEDADVAIDREYLGFSGNLSKTQISDKLRRASCSFVREKLQYDLKRQLIANGIKEDEFTVTVNVTPITTTDPEIIEIAYTSAFQDHDYIRPKVVVEVSGRSMNEPVVPVKLHSFIDEVFTAAPFTEQPFEVRAVVPERTFLEKICLLHEEFTKPTNLVRTERMSRHIYDISRIMDTPIAERALKDKALYDSVIEHRRTFIGLKDFDYDTLRPQTLRIVPPAGVIDLWRKDYEAMQATMIYGDSLPFDKLIEKIQLLNDNINSMEY
ncbi:nucleotidyl transferase AbiEii/AbiGii toxin family protein [Alistipes indistinctus]|uniref:nucleotidyl transferase AbiEii/AbiGii toxin family protein n=1 Tax=Alistipes indistinctus TaxID=626932 RepID=UPI0032BF7A7F